MSSRLSAWQSPVSRKRSILGLAAVLWLNMAVLPCAMAFQSAAMCLHCPPSDEPEVSAHHGHGEDQATASGATMQSDCCDQDEAKVDARVSKIEAKPASAVVFVTAPAVAELPTGTTGQRQCATDPPGLSGSSPPLHVLFCVYLD